MFVKKLTIKNFRNHKFQTYEFSDKINLITGDNGSGKTNIVEAIYYLSLARSFRTLDSTDLIKTGEAYAVIIADVIEGSIKSNIRIVINKEGKKVYLNDKPVNKLSELVKSINVILFEPKDVLLFKNSPKTRRNFLDINLSKKSQVYLECISRYSKVLKQRNEILKRNIIDDNILDVSTEMLVKLSKQIIRYRQIYINEINEVFSKIVYSLTDKKLDIKINYYPFINIDDDYDNNALNLFKKNKENDIKRKTTTLGIHREDFKVMINGHDIATFGSQGENRIVALALKISPYFVIKEQNKKPIIVLDDVMSELDADNKKRLIYFIKKLQQVFITATDLTIANTLEYKIKKKEAM